MQIGTIKLGRFPVFLAPMEDVSDPPFRVLCKEYGADLLYTEFISSGGLVYQAEESLQKLEFHEAERPVAIQIFGGDVEQVKQSIEIVNAARPDIIDINFGCPVKKVVCKDGGAGILRNLPKMEEIAKTVVERSDVPVTVKTRLGWSEDSIQIVEVVRMLQSTGIQAVAVHARTRAQMYKGTAQWEWLARLKEDSEIQIPIIGNGDALTPELIRSMFQETGVDAVMVGRGAIGNPWIFRDAKALLIEGEIPPAPSWEERLEIVARHLSLKCD
ncbi:MAG: tRNA dihydrouridine synthase DusB, partial [Acidobacteriota bacterium]